ncbi:MAG: FAD-dependent hydroxylase [Limnothrix sp. RL_2_0]|nr:FAD-dependent hydroxylase [Limnothrix sp. RL_2_0]
MQESESIFDVVIVGGGIVGSVLAASLKPSGLRVAIVETQPLDVVTQRKRAYAMSLLSQKIFQGLGLWSEIESASGKYRNIQLSDEDFSQVVRFRPQDLHTDFLGFSGQHEAMLTALQKTLATSEQVQWFCPARVMGVSYGADAATVSLTTVDSGSLQIQARLVVGADGARSPVREGAGIGTKGWKYWQSCVTFVVEHDAPRNDIAFERFWGTGPMGVLPLPGNRCQIVWTNPHAEAQRLKSLDDASFLAQLQPFVKPLGQVRLVGDRQIFPVQLMQSDRYVKERLALIGDAAHCCHPVGGQGLNLGIRDAVALAQILTEAYTQQKDIGQLPVLRRYERWRKLENLLILSFTDLLNRLFSNRFLPIVLLRRFGLMLMSAIAPLRLFALKLMAGQKGKQPDIAMSVE